MTIEERINQLQQAIQSEPEQAMNWIMLSLYAVMGNQYDQALQLFEKREELFQDGVDLQFAAMVSDIIADNPQMLNLVANMKSPEIKTAYDAVTVFAVGAAKICMGRIGEGRTEMYRLLEMPEDLKKRFDGIPHIKRADLMLDMFFTKTEIHEMLADEPAAWEPEITALGEAPPQDVPYLIFTLADQDYFDRFGPGFLKAMQEVAPIHVHVINGVAEKLESVLAEFGGRVTATMEPFGGENLAPYCANSRFLQVQRMMAKGGPDIICMDIDVESIRDFDHFLEGAKGQDVSLFQDCSTIPWLRHWATCIYFRHGDVSKRYLDVLCHVVRSKIDELKWLFDQSALLSIYFLLEEELGQGTINILTEPNGFRLHNIITPSGKLEEKLALRKGTGIEI